MNPTNIQNIDNQTLIRELKRIEKPKLQEIAEKARLRITDEISENPICLVATQKDVTYKIGTLGNILLVQAKAKAGKTYFTSSLVASWLSGKPFLYFKGILPRDKQKVIYFDTEQGIEDARTIQDRIYKLAGLNQKEEAHNFEYYCLRRLDSRERCDVIDYIIHNTENLGIVVIDGIRDLINDFNDTGQSFIMINKLMTWTDDLKINITAILHQNPNDEKARGHLGTELTNKAEFIISLIREKEDDSYRRVEGYGRRKHFSPFNYSMDEAGFPILSNQQREFGKIDPLALDLQIHKNIIDLIFQKCENGTAFSKNALFPKIKYTFSSMGNKYKFSNDQCKNLVEHYLKHKLIINNGTDDKMKLQRV